MNADKHDPIFDSLDRLAGVADRDVVSDRMLDIQRRVRMARRRRVAGVGLAAAAVVAAGLGVWQTLPTEKPAPDPAPDVPKIEQTVTIRSKVVAADRIKVQFTVEGRSSAYTDAQTGDPSPAGPLGTQLYVDGELAQETLGDDLTCEPGGDVAAYALALPAPPKKFFTVSVSGPGEHAIEVRAPYCADGTLVDEPTRATVASEPDPPTVTDLTADVDGDGAEDTAHLIVPAYTSGSRTVELTVDWAGGGSASLELPYDEYSALPNAIDLDGDGARELVVSGGGGDTIAWRVVRASGRELALVSTVDASGADRPLVYSATESGGGPQNLTWQSQLGTDGFTEFKFVDAQPRLPAAVLIRRWVLNGDTMTLQDTTARGCADLAFQLNLGPC